MQTQSSIDVLPSPTVQELVGHATQPMPYRPGAHASQASALDAIGTADQVPVGQTVRDPPAHVGSGTEGLWACLHLAAVRVPPWQYEFSGHSAHSAPSLKYLALSRG